MRQSTAPGTDMKFSTSGISREAAKNAKETIFTFAATKEVATSSAWPAV
jgi:hypothetical protein